MNGRERILAMIAGDPTDHLPLMPITMMFAADRIGAAYLDYATNYQVMAEAQARTAEEFRFDYVSAISDPAREAADCGAEIEYFPDQPPAIIETRALLADKAALTRLPQPDPLGGGRMHDRVKAVAELKERVGQDLLIEGWVEGPCAEAADLRGINSLMLDFMDDPQFIRNLFAFIVEMELAFAGAQVDAGADLIGLGDAAASLVGPTIYEEFVWDCEKQLVDGIQAMGAAVRLHICGNTSRILEGMGKLGCEIVDIDYMVPLAEARRAMGPEQVLLGNIDPVRELRNTTAEQVADNLQACLDVCTPRYIVGAGCEIPRDTSVRNVMAMTAFAESH